MEANEECTQFSWHIFASRSIHSMLAKMLFSIDKYKSSTRYEKIETMGRETNVFNT